LNYNFWITTKILAVIFTIIISLYFTFSTLSSPYNVKAVKGKDVIAHSSISINDPSSKKGNTLSSSHSLAAQSSNPSTSTCITYGPSTRTITVSCTNPTRITDVNTALHDNSILDRQTPDGVWLLSANLLIAKGAVFHIDSTDTKWLKINSRAVGGSTLAYSIGIQGSVRIDSVRITGWDQLKNTYALSNGSRTGSGTYIYGTPRPGLYVDYNATGTSNITNSEIGYLGYETGMHNTHKADSGLSYYGGNGSVIRNNNIHNLYFGFYSAGLSHAVIENNIISNSGYYGLDPHSGTHDLIIRNNTVYNNKGSGIICSLNCYNILIENNKVHDNAGDGIDFSRFTYNSLAKNNIVYNEPNGILITRSHNNQVYNNSVSNSVEGIKVESASNFNKVVGNLITNSKAHAILVNNGSSSNTFYSNKIISATPAGLKIEQDPSSKNNVFNNNQIVLLPKQ
jgi:mannuronan 5-epimerase